MRKKQNLLTKFFTKNKSVESTDHETGLIDAALREVSIENTDDGSKARTLQLAIWTTDAIGKSDHIYVIWNDRWEFL